ncbi:MAG: 30S ribosomal protein S2 [Coriobacteriales bacterium]|nr:30S ribosomal protein S2 [Coriobacteriales bacterium]
MAQINISTLLKAGVHFGHQTRRWCPKMKPYIFGERNGIYILDLKQTIIEADKAYSFLAETASKGGEILFVGTKKQAQEAIMTEAERSGMPYVANRWLGGMLTNFVTIRSRVARMEELEAMQKDGRMEALPKKEQVRLNKELAKLQANLEGIRNMKSLPKALFVVDTRREENAIREANRLHIPVVAIIDTNSDPDVVEYGIPANDDAIRSISLMSGIVADAILAGRGNIEITAEEMNGAAAEAEEDVEIDQAEAMDLEDELA